MLKIIKYGFLPIKSNLERGQNNKKGLKLFQAGHVLEVTETTNIDRNSRINGKIVAQTKISNVYDAQITLDNSRNIISATCKCKAGLSGKCKHICAMVWYINSPQSSQSKTSQTQQWGKPSHRQLLGYDKGLKMSELFPSPPKSENMNEMIKVLEKKNISTEILGESLSNTPLYRILQLEEKTAKEIIAAETLVDLVRITEERKLGEMLNKIICDILELQCHAKYYTSEPLVPQFLYKFYNEKVSCDFNTAVHICCETQKQGNCVQWFKQRLMRITASNAHKLKGTRFDKQKVINDLINMRIVQTSAMAYGKKMEDVALIKYKESFPHFEVVKTGLVVNCNQPWLSCSPDAVVVYGSNIWEKRLVEIKCPAKCKNIAIVQRDVINVQYLKIDENGLQLKNNNSIYTQIQIQMYVTNICVCDLYVYSPMGSEIVSVKRNDVFLCDVVPRLEMFYFKHYLPKLFTKYNED